MHNKWEVYGVSIVLVLGSITSGYAFDFSPGRWMDPSEWFGNNNHNYRPLPPPPMRPQGYPPAYRLPTAPAYVYSAPTVLPTTPATPRAAIPQSSTITPPAAPLKFKESVPAGTPSSHGSKLKWTDKKATMDNQQEDRSFSFAPAGYLQDLK